jgi:soluble lytic murein transglycosylase
MSARSSSRVSSPAGGSYASARRPSATQRRRRVGAVVALAVTALFVLWIAPRINHAVRDLTLPLRDQDIIRQQARAKHLDPALVAAVIFAETKFQPRTSATGAEGLMQIEPATAQFLARLSDGYAFTTRDLATPSINIAYGSYYLRYLLDHYGGNEMLAVAAYNGGLANVDRWIAAAQAQGRTLTIADIPFPETRAYVARVLEAQREYRAAYATQLGIA